MSGIDWGIIVVYLVGMIAVSMWLARGQKTGADYYVGGRTLPWWALAISTMATQTSTNSFIGIPAFVALRPGGGLTWLQYELAVPLAMMVVMVFLMPFFRRLELISVYEYLELRFDRRTRLFMSGVFLFSRGAATGIGVYGASIVLSVCLDLPQWACVFLITGVTVVYDTLGGMKAVVFADVVQLAVLVTGIVLCIYLAVNEAGGIAAVIGAHDPARLHAVDLRTGILDGSTAPFWGFLIGGLILYASYYGVDQSQAQRAMSAPTVDDAKRGLVFNGLARFPLTLLYITMGLAVGAVYWKSPDLQATIPHDHLDYLIPQYVRTRLPPGARGILFAALLSAAMTSLESALNSLSAATMRDFVEPHIREERQLRWSKITTALWGVALTGFAFLVGGVSTTVVEGINKLGAFFYGPLLAAFLTGILDRRARGPGMLLGVLAGVGTNWCLWVTFGDRLFWMWWNTTGLTAAVLVTFVGSRFMAAPSAASLERTTFIWDGFADRERGWFKTYAFLFAYFLFMLGLTFASHSLLQALAHATR